MTENPYQAPAEASHHEVGHETYRAAALYGATRGGMYVGGFILILGILQLGVYLYFWFTNPRFANALLEGRSAASELVAGLGSVLLFGTIGAICGAAWCPAREWGRRKRRIATQLGQAGQTE